MKTKRNNLLITFSFILYTFYLFAPLSAQTKQELLSRLKSDPYKTVERVAGEGEIYKITDKLTGRVIYKDFSDRKTDSVKDSNVTTTIIVMSEIDTALYTDMYYHWKTFDVTAPGIDYLRFADINNNNKPEIYGHRLDIENDILDWGIFEYDPDTQELQFVHQYIEEPNDSCIENTYSSVASIYDINKNGRKQVLMRSSCSVTLGSEAYTRGKVFMNRSEFELPIHKDFEYHEHGQLNDFRFGDFDNDGISDLVYFNSGQSKVKMCSYDSVNNTFKIIDEIKLNDFDGAGFSTADIDMDGYADITFGSIHGTIWVYEYSPVDSTYPMIFRDELGVSAAYIHFNTNDIDGNGKKEFWVGGDSFGLNKTRLACYESTGNNSFVRVHNIDLLGIASLEAYNALAYDIDRDGSEEIILCLDDNFFIFDFNGRPNQPSYYLYYHKKNPNHTNPFNYTYNGANMYDIDSDGELEIFINQHYSTQPGPGHRKGVTFVYKKYGTNNVAEKKYNQLQNELYQNVPNPFNPVTYISYRLAKESFVNISVYNVLGEQVKILVNELKSPGNCEIEFAGHNLPSGIYLITMQAGDFRKTIKTILLK